MEVSSFQLVLRRFGARALGAIADNLVENPDLTVPQLEGLLFAKTVADNDQLRQRIQQIETELAVARAQIERLQGPQIDGLAFILRQVEPVREPQAAPPLPGSDADDPDPASGFSFSGE